MAEMRCEYKKAREENGNRWIVTDQARDTKEKTSPY